MSGVYAITHIPSGKVYIGSSINIELRLKGHIRKLRKGTHPNRKLQHAWSKHGEAEFECKTLECCSEGSRISREQYYINLFAACGQNGYNICPNAGVTVGYRHTEATKAKISLASKGNKYLLGKKASPETVARRVAALTGQKRSDEARARMSQAMKGKKQSPEHLAKLSQVRKGRKLTEEHKAKISAAGLGRVHSEESKAKIGAANKGRKLSEEHKEAVRRARTGVVQSEETKAKRLASRARFYEQKALL